MPVFVGQVRVTAHRSDADGNVRICKEVRCMGAHTWVVIIGDVITTMTDAEFLGMYAPADDTARAYLASLGLPWTALST